MSFFFPIKNRFGFFAVTGLICLSLFIPAVALAANTLPDTPYDEDLSDRAITLNHVGNHTAGDVFLIHGTTSLPAGRKLAVHMHLGGCRVGYCIRSEHYGYTVVVNGSPGMNTWSYQLNTTGFWTIDYDGDRWAYDISVWDDQFVTVGDHETIYLFNQSESVPTLEDTGLNTPGASGLPQSSSLTTGPTGAHAGKSAPVPVIVPVAALGITGMLLLGKRDG
ncbi:MAG: hypothetical protein A4E35_00731 [Methanoregula sp. PtaU1.Bin051]|nr:MAG: hypothetical protein A4E35_00731 [Methanoregula sp. PtaU1.Bin051]